LGDGKGANTGGEVEGGLTTSCKVVDSCSTGDKDRDQGRKVVHAGVVEEAEATAIGGIQLFFQVTVSGLGGGTRGREEEEEEEERGGGVMVRLVRCPSHMVLMDDITKTPPPPYVE